MSDYSDEGDDEYHGVEDPVPDPNEEKDAEQEKKDDDLETEKYWDDVKIDQEIHSISITKQNAEIKEDSLHYDDTPKNDNITPPQMGDQGEISNPINDSPEVQQNIQDQADKKIDELEADKST